MEASQLEIEEQLLKKNSPKRIVLGEKILEKSVMNYLRMNQQEKVKTWQREGIDILLIKLGINKEDI